MSGAKLDYPGKPAKDNRGLRSRREFLARLRAAAGAAGILSLAGRPVTALAQDTVTPSDDKVNPATIFPTNLPELQWTQFEAKGFSRPVSGVLFRASNPPCCGAPVGGLDTGCIDIDARGAYGLSSIFNPWSPSPHVKEWRMPRKPAEMEPLLGLSTGGKTWVLATQAIIDGGAIPVCQDPFYNRSIVKADTVTIPKLEGVQAVREIYYWGHYPVVDLEFETDAPVSVGLRAWAPFLPGDKAASNLPAAIFETHLRNSSAASQSGSLAFNFPGPNQQEAGGAEFFRETVNEDMRGVMVGSRHGVNYVLGVIGEERFRVGAGLNETSTAWSQIASELPHPTYRDVDGRRLYQNGSSSVAVDFSLAPGEQKTVRFLLAWFAPVWKGAEKDRIRVLEHYHMGGTLSSWKVPDWYKENANYYTHMYAARYNSALDVARRMAAEHEPLLRRVLAWQSVIYAEATLPVWLRDSLVNNLCLITEAGVWAQAKPPLGDWAYPGGVFGMIESPRGDPDMANIPCDWYGNIPVVYFFPELALSTLRAYKAMQREDGAAPFWLGLLGELPDFATASYDWQISLNGTCYADLVDRVWQRTGDDAVLREFYESVKKCNTLTMNLRQGPAGVISMPEGDKGREWFEAVPWAGMCTHMGGLHLAQLRIVERMARHSGDLAYAKRCQDWRADGSKAMEEELWAGNYYLSFYEKETGKKSDDVMAYQLDGEWAALYHGTPGVFRADRVKTVLETVKRCNVALTPNVGAANFTRPDGSPQPPTAKGYGPYSVFAAELVVLAMTYIYEGQKEFGLDLARRHWENDALRQKHAWDMPNVVRGDTGIRVYGTDYYQNMILWAIPAAVAGETVGSAGKPGGLVSRVIKAAASA